MPSALKSNWAKTASCFVDAYEQCTLSQTCYEYKVSTQKPQKGCTKHMLCKYLCVIKIEQTQTTLVTKVNIVVMNTC